MKMKKIKILHVGLSSNLGGIEKYLINIHRNINFDEFDIDYLVFKGQKVCFFDEIVKKSNIFEITKRTENYKKYIDDLKEFFKKSNYDYIEFHLMEFSCFERILYAKKYTKSKIILHSHIANHKISSLKTRLLNMVGKIIVKKNDTYLKVACSNSAGIYMFKDFKNNNFTILNNGIDIKEFQFNQLRREKIRKELKIENKFVIGNIGRLVEQKNQTFLLDIFDEVIKRKNDCVLLLIGKGKLKNELEKKATCLNIKDKIIHIDNTNQIRDYLCAMDTFVFPSLFEGLGIVLIEAQASGLNCFFTDTLPVELNVSDNAKRISLTEHASVWAENILKTKIEISKRAEINDLICKTNFNIKKSVEILEKYYIDNL